MTAMTLKEEIAANTPRYLEELTEFLSIPSISTDEKQAHNVQKCAAWLESNLVAMNASSARIHQTTGHPIVTAQFGEDPLKPTVLVYGHYDVQPTGKDEDWVTPPFEPEVRDGKIYARGATDDKGQVFAWLKAVELLQKDGKELPCNVRFLIEGEEEVASTNLMPFLVEHPEITQCDTAVISDTAGIDEETPAITVSVRGHVGVDVTFKGPTHEVHSGVYGGAIANPLIELSKKIGTVTDKDGYILLPGFYNGVRKYSDAERAEINVLGDMAQTVMDETGVTGVHGQMGYTTTERTGILPAFTPLSIHGGPPEGVFKGVISPKATAKMAMRLVPGQNPAAIGDMLCKHFSDGTPPGIIVEAEKSNMFDAWALPSMDSPAYRAAAKAYESSWGKTPVPVCSGGSIPVVPTLEKNGVSPILMGFGLESDGLHSPNEHISINRVQKGIETAALFLQNFADSEEMKKKYPKPVA